MVGAWAAAWGRVAAGRALPDVVNAEAPEARRAAAVYFYDLCACCNAQIQDAADCAVAQCRHTFHRDCASPHHRRGEPAGRGARVPHVLPAPYVTSIEGPRRRRGGRRRRREAQGEAAQEAKAGDHRQGPEDAGAEEVRSVAGARARE